MPDAPKARQFLHSCYINRLPDGSDAVVVSELVHYEDGRVVPQLNVIKKPKRSFYVTKTAYRNHNEKKEIENVAALDKYTVPNSELEREIFKVFNGYYPSKYVGLKDLCVSPYLYGADVSIETLIKADYQKRFDATGRSPAPATTGFFDIEWSVLQGNLGEITVISMTHEHRVYTAILEHAFFYIDAHGQRVQGVLDELKALGSTILPPMIDQVLSTNKGLKQHRDKKFEFFYFVGNTEIVLIEWIFAQLHALKTSLIGIWNIDADIPAILKALKRANVAPETIFCPTTIDMKYHKVDYRHDDKKVAHPTDKWHWLYCTSHTQFYDSMAWYAKLRTVNGKEAGGYSLDNVLEQNGLGGKLHFSELPDLADLSKIDWHRRMQSRYPYYYIIYNQWDVISIQLMEWKSSDAQSMLLLSESTSLAKLTKQTRKVSDTLYVDWIEKGWVLGTTAADMKSPYDDDIGAVGGAVLSPLRLDYSGLNVLVEAPHHKTQLHAFVNDVDFTGMYPTIGQAANISKDTKLSTVLYITGDAVQKHYAPKEAVEAFFGHIINPTDNAVALGVEFWGLLNYEEMLQLYNNTSP